MNKSADTINRLFAQAYDSGESDSDFRDAAEVLSEFENISINIFDNYGNEYISVKTEDSLNRNISEKIESNISELAERNDDEFGWTSQNDSDIYSTPVLSVCFPIRTEKTVKGRGFMHIRLSAYEDMINHIFKGILFCLLFSIAAVGVITYFWYKNTIRTVNNINKAAGAFARGDFSQRVSVTGSDEIATLAMTYNNMADELEKYESTRQSFVANVSHELRSPLTSIQGFVQGMLDGTIEQQEMPQYLDIVLNESKRMSILIHDLLDLAKIESGQFPLDESKYDICEEIRRTLISFIGKIEDKNIVLTADIPSEQKMVLADKSRIAQVLTNLFDNAVKFCEDGGSLKIWTYDADGRIHVNISNSGAYIPEEDLPYVFDRFFKVDKSHNKKYAGTGIGLSIVKNIIKQHGEKIWVNSRKGTGTIFTFTLRLSDTEEKNEKNKKQVHYGRI